MKQDWKEVHLLQVVLLLKEVLRHLNILSWEYNTLQLLICILTILLQMTHQVHFKTHGQEKVRLFICTQIVRVILHQIQALMQMQMK
jgi:hypothetical protein